jgi:uncharacterized protein (DUF1684 family)
MQFLSGIVGIALLAGMNPGKGQADPGYADRITQWRAQQETDLRAPEGWLSVAGLSWLSEGDNSIGSGSSYKVILPSPAPENVGTLNLAAGEVTLSVATGVTVQIDGKPVTSVVMAPDVTGKPNKAKIGDITFEVIHRGKRIGVRIWDENCPARRNFTGMKWYPIKPAYVIKAKYTAYDTPKQIPITNVLGDISMNANPGYVEFTLYGKACRLEAQAEDNSLFFNFLDKTSGSETYPAGRFLDAPLPKDGFVTLDFNQATNPPCAFTAFATCPLPPKGNRLDVAVKAGEKTYHSH